MSRYGPFSPRGRFGDPLSVMRQELTRMAEEFSRFAAPPETPGGARMALARVDMSETEDALEIDIEAPGVDDRGLDVSLRGDLLTIRAVRDVARDDHERNWHVRERASAGVTRTITLPFAPDPQAVSAQLAHGVLHIVVQKTREPSARSVRIPISGGADAPNGAPRNDAQRSSGGTQGPVDPAI